MDIGWWIGFFGGILLAISYLPQAKRVWDRRKTGLKDISIVWLAIGLCGTILMLGYGFIIDQPSIVVLNTLVFCVYSFMLSLAFDRKEIGENVIIIDKKKYAKAVETKPLTIETYKTIEMVGHMTQFIDEDELSKYMMKINYDEDKK